MTTKITLTNEGGAAVTYAVTHVPALSTTGTTYAPTPLAGGYAGAVFDATSVTVPAGGSADVSATITADPALEGGALYGGYLVFTPQGAGATGTLRVPYSGFKGITRRSRSSRRPPTDIPGSPTRPVQTSLMEPPSPCKTVTYRASSPTSSTPPAR